MQIKSVAVRLREQDWFAVVIELVVVVVGILIALQLDQWADARKERAQERVYLERLRDDLTAEQADARAAASFARNRLEAVEVLQDLSDGKLDDATDPRQAPWALETATWRSFPKTRAYVYGELQSSGQMGLIHSVELRRKLADHYALIAHFGRVAEDLSAQMRFDAATAGLLFLDELAALEATGGGTANLQTDEARAKAIAQQFQQLDAAKREIPSLSQHHLFNLRVIGEMDERLDQLVALIDQELQRR